MNGTFGSTTRSRIHESSFESSPTRGLQRSSCAHQVRYNGLFARQRLVTDEVVYFKATGRGGTLMMNGPLTTFATPRLSKYSSLPDMAHSSRHGRRGPRTHRNSLQVCVDRDGRRAESCRAYDALKRRRAPSSAYKPTSQEPRGP